MLFYDARRIFFFFTVACLTILLLPWTAGGQNKSVIFLAVACLTIFLLSWTVVGQNKSVLFFQLPV